MKKIGLSIILTFIISGCTTTQPTQHQNTQQTTSQPISVSYEMVTNQEPVIYSEPIVETQAPQQENISVTEAFSMIQNQDVTILDVRTYPETISDRKIANSQLIPLQVLGSYLDRLDNSKPILVYCRTGNRSAVASEILRSQGFNAINVLGGINAWKANGLPVE